jgi:uncharacterized membrane protein
VTAIGPTIGSWEVASDVSEWIEIIAIGVISVTVVVALVVMLRSAAAERDAARAFQVFKEAFSRGVLLSLDLLIAADIIRTVTLEPTLENVAALGLLVVVRTFLSWALVLEAEGRWPWQRPGEMDTTLGAVEPDGDQLPSGTQLPTADEPSSNSSPLLRTKSTTLTTASQSGNT